MHLFAQLFTVYPKAANAGPGPTTMGSVHTQ